MGGRWGRGGVDLHDTSTRTRLLPGVAHEMQVVGILACHTRYLHDTWCK